jgi:hypothetical protein
MRAKLVSVVRLNRGGIHQTNQEDKYFCNEVRGLSVAVFRTNSVRRRLRRSRILRAHWSARAHSGSSSPPEREVDGLAIMRTVAVGETL